MTKLGPIGIRLEREERAALERAAAADDRSMSALARKIILEWLKKHGHMKPSRKS
jgi:uncharacterized protein (DUF1778 family)